MMIALELVHRHHHHVNNSGWGAIAVLMIIVAIAGIITAKDKRNK